MEKIENQRRIALSNASANRFFVICVLIILSNIPLFMVKTIVRSREIMFNNTMNEISSSWGGRQTIIAPILNIPIEVNQVKTVYNREKKVDETIVESKKKIYNILPENLNITVVMVPEIRHRGIYNVLVYSAKLDITGNFEKVDIGVFEPGNKILWDKAWLSIGVDPSSLRGDIEVSLGNRANLELNSGSGSTDFKGISTNINLNDKSTAKNFRIQLQFNGSSDLSFAPLGKKNNFEVISSWPHPIFKNTFRPDNPEISENGFIARWSIPYIARNYPQVMVNYDNMKNVEMYLASVGLFDAMPVYKKSSRLMNYGIMFITLTFVMMFLFERKIKQTLHHIQYVIVGLAISLFFLTVLSFSEYISFALSYAAASAVVIAMISMYLYAALRSRKLAVVGAVIMAFLYGILYLMLSEADYALLIGTLILLATIGVIMWETRDINTKPLEIEGQ